jgi:uncharacterized protein YlxP (DUF503 family)
MHVGILQFELVVPGSTSLKDKRRVVKSLKDRLHRAHLVSVAEVGALEHHRLALMGVAMVSNSTAHIESTFDRILEKVRALGIAHLGEVSREIVSGDVGSGAAGEDASPLWTEDERRTSSPSPVENAA